MQGCKALQSGNKVLSAMLLGNRCCSWLFFASCKLLVPAVSKLCEHSYARLHGVVDRHYARTKVHHDLSEYPALRRGDGLHAVVTNALCVDRACQKSGV